MSKSNKSNKSNKPNIYTIGFIERGEFSPSIALSLRLAKHLQVRVDELFWLEGEDDNDEK